MTEATGPLDFHRGVEALVSRAMAGGPPPVVRVDPGGADPADVDALIDAVAERFAALGGGDITFVRQEGDE